MRKLFSTLLLTVTVSLASQALNVNVTPGCLYQAVDEETDVTELAISGSMDARDFLFISETLDQLTTLDLSQVTIVPFNKNVPIFGTYVNYHGNEIPRTAFFGKPLRTVILPEGIEGIGYAAFAGCDQLESIVLPSSLTYLEDYAFAGSGLTSIDLPSNIIEMGAGVFSRCPSLTQATVNCQTLGSFAFLGDTELVTVNIGNRVGNINEGAFNGCFSLTTVNFDPACSLRIGDEAFINSGINQLDIKSIGINSIGDWALSQTRLTSIALSDGMTHLGMGALAHNPSLTSVSLPGVRKVNVDGSIENDPVAEPTGSIGPKGAPVRPRLNMTLERIGAYTFAGDGDLDMSRLLIHGVRIVEPYAFYNNSHVMDTVYLPSTLDFLGDSAMAGMTGMRVLKTAAEEVPELGLGVWAGVDQRSIPLITPSKEAKAEYMVADQWMNFFFAPDFIRGDVNNDGIVNIADVTSLIDYILSGNGEEINLDAADVDGDGYINIADVTNLIDLILYGNSVKSLPEIRQELDNRFNKTNDAITVSPTTLKIGETGIIEVSLSQEDNNYIAMQCELVLPRGVELTQVETADKSHSWQMVKNETEDNAYTLIGSSLENGLFAGDKVVRLAVTANDTFDATAAQAELTNIMLVTEKRAIVLAGDATSRLNENTAIEMLNTEKEIAKVTYINVAGQQSAEPFDGMNIVVTTYGDGTTMTTKVIK